MSSATESDDPLLRAIAELRTDLLHLIDDQVAYWKERVEELPPPRAVRPAPVLNVAEPQEVAAKARPLDPRQRLDALAKHLDHRLRLANVPAPDRVERAASPED
jgi:hypothetical protein